MSNDLEIKLNTLINFGISLTEDLSPEIKKERQSLFRKEVCVEKYLDLFNEVEKYLLDTNVTIEEKEKIVKLVLETINLYPKLNENVEKLPFYIRQLYNSSEKLYSLGMGLEFFLESEVLVVVSFENILLQYLNFLDSPENEFYIQHCYSKINCFNKRIISGLDALDFDGIRKGDKLTNQDLLSHLKTKINDLNEKRNV